MKITVRHDDGTEVDVTDLVRVAYDCLWESTTWGQEVGPEDADELAQLAEACRYASAPTARQVADDLLRSKAEAEERYNAWLRGQGAGARLWGGPS